MDEQCPTHNEVYKYPDFTLDYGGCHVCRHGFILVNVTQSQRKINERCERKVD